MELKSMFTKLSVAVLLFSSLSFGGQTVLAETSSPTENELVEVNEETVSNLALELAKVIKPEVKVTIADITKLYDKNESAIGFVVSYKSEETPYGYSVYDFRVPGYLMECSIDENVGDIVDKTVEMAEAKGVDVNSNVENKDVKVIEVEPLKYSVEVNDTVTVTSDNEILTTEQEVIEMEESAEDVTVTNSEFVTDSELNQLVSTSKYDSQDKVLLRETARGLTNIQFRSWRQFIPSIESEVESQTGIWGCAVSAMDILAKGTNLEHNTKVAYPKLWKYAKTTQYKVQNGIKYGSTNNGNIGAGFVQFAKEKKKNISYQNISSPSFGQFKSAIDNKKPAIFAYGIIKANTKERTGHAVAVEGYMSSKQANYLVVADGWFAAAKYVNYIPGNFLDTYGIIWSGIQTI
ncbi:MULTISPECIES: hypothetical protein [unclassified Enterococcus]|uniref:hypothetical protein n=1 Tax=unclassified Enterococcus TaxID=2608891 RepID=UPI001CE09914|nr:MULTISPECIES: hypothetical protein [unclassified Enterococcus]MCA5014227.1 hypothetical protein [Enterococcus sp. S23]MCA5017553.1 hypothetical protein [Enterococcus sp. S22(2020)]